MSRTTLVATVWVLSSMATAIATPQDDQLEVVVAFEEGDISRNIARFYDYLYERELLPTADYVIETASLASELRRRSVFPIGYPGEDADRILCKLNPNICATVFDEEIGERVTRPVRYNVGDTIQIPDLEVSPYEFSVRYVGEIDEREPALEAIEREATYRGATVEQRNDYRKLNEAIFDEKSQNLRVPARGFQILCALPEEEVLDVSSELYMIDGLSIAPFQKSARPKSQFPGEFCDSGAGDPCDELFASSLEQIHYWHPPQLCERTDQAGVAIFDFEVDRTHSDFYDDTGPAFQDTTAVAVQGAPRCLPESATAERDHGTHIAGIIGARRNERGIVGVHPHARLVSYTNRQNELAAHVVSAWEDYGVRVVNASWSYTGLGPHPLDTDRYARRTRDYDQLLFVVAAGNEHNEFQTEGCGSSIPVCLFNLPNVIVVAALNTSGDELWPETNFGDGVVHLAAPGQSIVSTSSGNRLSKASGSSQAAAFVSGAAALLFSMYERVSAEDVKERLIYTADLLPALEGEVVSGRLNVRRAAEYFNRDVVRLKTEQNPLVGRLRRYGGVFLFGPDELFREGGEYVRASRIRRIVYHKETEDYTVLAVGDHGFQRYSHVKFQPADSPAYQNEDDKLSMKVDGRWRRIRLSNIVDLAVAAPL